MVIDCVGKDRAAKFQEVLFKLQEKWAFHADFKDSLQKISAVGGLPEAEFKACMENKAVEEKILTSRQVATETLEIPGTPAFFINGVPLNGKITVESFDHIIQGLTKK
jgi:protein-disulfide isomerase